jgi:long-chain acyl-CoA synthetase
MKNVADILTHQANLQPSKVCLIESETGRSFSYFELNRLADRVAKLLRKCGVSSGDRVVLLLPNVLEYLYLFFGSAKIGAVVVPFDIALKELELTNLINHCEPKVMFMTSAVSGKYKSLKNTGLNIVVGNPTEAGDLNLKEALEEVDDSPVSHVHDSDLPLMLFYTSGTTGNPKGVVHAHSTILVKTDAWQKRVHADSSHRILCLLPLSFIATWVVDVFPSLYCGGTLALCSPFDSMMLSQLGTLIRTYQVKSFSVVPAILRILLHIEVPEVSQCRFVICSGAPLSVDAIERFEKKYGVPILHLYGMTEATLVAIESLDNPERGKGSVGKPLACEIKISDSGEVCLRGCLMLGYFRRPDLTQEAIQGGWFHTGDLGQLDVHGNVYLEGRSKEIIIRAGRNIYPNEVDGVIGKHDAVTESVTFGIPDPVQGEKIVSVAVLKPGTELAAPDLIAHCRQYLVDYKCPSAVRFVDSIPKNNRGKINRRSVAMWAQEKFPDLV